jgi:CRP-like cAMP-binding protein
MTAVLDQHAAWLAKSLGRTDYLPMRPEDAVALAEAGTMVDKHKGTHLFREGNPADACYIITSGEVDLYRTTAHGRSVVGRIGSGAVVGDIAMFQDEPYLSSAQARTNVRAVKLDREVLIPLLLARPVLSMRWLVNGLSQLEATQQRLIRLMNRTVVEQVAGILLDEQDPYGEVGLSQASLAELLGASRQSVNEALSQLRAAGAIETGYRRVSVVDTDMLESMSSG